jgi:PAS domain S-box-containing protein
MSRDMSKDKNYKIKFSNLRKRAESLMMKSEEHFSDMSAEDIKKLIHELGTHQIELELQNDELKNTQEKLEESKNHFFELFQLAPFGYFKLDDKGKIIESNLATNDILGLDKASLMNRKFTDFIKAEYQDEFYKIFSKHSATGEKKSCEIKIKKNKRDIWVHLEISLLKNSEDAEQFYLLTIIETTKEKRLHKACNELSIEKIKLDKRVKELNCFYELTNLVDHSSNSIEVIFKGLVELIPSSFQFPDKTSVKAVYKNTAYYSENYIETDDPLKADIYASDTNVGKIEVHCSLQSSKSKESKFLNDEILLLDILINRLCRVIERICSKEELSMFRNLVDCSSDSVFFIDPENSGFIDVNKMACLSLGYTREDLLTMGVIDVEAVIPDEFSWRKHVEAIYKKETFLIEGEHIRKNGTIFPVEVNISTAEYLSRKYIIAIARDITERKKAEKALKQSEKQLKSISEKLVSILSNIPEVIYSAKADSTGTILYISDRWEDWTGYPPEECYRNPEIWPNSIHHDDRQETIAHYVKVISEGRENASEYRLVNKKTGKVRWVYDHGIPIKNKNGRILRYEGIVTDITKQKEAEKMLIQSQKLQATGTLAGGMAHEFNNILGIIMGYAQILKEGKDLTEEQNDGITLIYKQGEKAAQIIDNILNFCRHEEIELELIDLATLLEDTLKITKLILPHNIKLTSNIENNLPLINGNSVQIQQTLLNILNNSVSAMGEIKGTIKITLGLENSNVRKNHPNPDTKEKYLKLCIEDEGRGMTDEAINQAFNPFFTTKEPGKGTGLGLSVVHGIVKSHKGEVTINSEIDKGTVLCIFFPAAQDYKEEYPDYVSKVPLKGEESILIVDDETALMDVLNISLSKLGYRITITERTIEALKLVTDSPGSFDLIISDYAMPEMTGIELYNNLSKIKQKCPFILISGYKNINMDSFVRQNKNVVFLKKPLQIADLTHKIRNIFNK